MPPALAQRSESEGGSPGTFEGYGAVFNSRTVIYGIFTESIRPGAFRDSIESKKRVMSLFNHDVNNVLGSTDSGLRLREDEKGLWVENELPNTSDGRDVAELIRRGDVRGQSFMFYVTAEEWTYPKRDDELPHCDIIAVDLLEVGPVVWPAYETTSIGLRSRAEERFSIARAAWERANKPPEPVIVRGVCPIAVLAGVRARRSRYAAAA